MSRSFTFIALAALAIALPAGAQTERPPAVTAMRVTTPPVIDGRAEDAAWMSGPVSTDFLVFAPREGAEPTVRTEARVRYDDRALYVLVRAFDPHPDSIVRRLARRDTFDQTADLVLVFLDPFHDGRTGYEFDVTASGVKIDGVLVDDGTEDPSWDGVWDAATRVDSLGWVAEIAIPFRELRFAEHRAPTFGIIIGRWIGRSGERMSVPQFSRAKAGLASQMGILAGLRDLPDAGTLAATPYTLARARNLPARGAEAASLETRPAIGGDVKWLPRANVSVDATFNPDFGQVEADPAVVNLTGLEIFQAERRPFFVEGAGLLALPLAADGSGQLFYSRRIGRRPALTDFFGAVDSPTETTIDAAAKLTARAGSATSFAALAAVTGRAEGAERLDGRGRYVLEPRAADVVARFQRNFRDGRSGVGVMFTGIEREASDSLSAAMLPSSARTIALTTQHQTSDGAFQASGWFASSDVNGRAPAITRLQLSTVHAFQRPDDGIAFDSTRTRLGGPAMFVSVGKVAGGISRFSASYRRISPGFDVNDLGFLTTSGVQNVSSTVGISQTRPGSIGSLAYRRATATLGYSGDWSTSGLPFARNVNVDATMQLADLSEVHAQIIQQLPGALCSVNCTRGGRALVDPPRFTASLDYRGDQRRSFVPHVLTEFDRDDQGRSHGYGAQVDATWRIKSNLDASLAGYAFNTHYAWFFYRVFGDARSDTAHYTVAHLDNPTRSLTGRLNYTLTTTLTVQWYGQVYVSRGAYDDVREIVNSRARDWNERFRPYADPTVQAQPGGVDFKQLRSNTVLRWEYRPGSVLFVVWSQARDVNGNSPGRLGLWPGRDFGDVFTLRPQNSVAVKLSYWMSR